MSQLLLVKLHRSEDRASPEFEYLLGWLRVQAKRVFRSMRDVTVESPEQLRADDLDGDEGYVLLLGSANVLLGQASLDAMRRVLDGPEERATVVVPQALEQTDLPSRCDLFTLHDFEQAERQFLDQQLLDQQDDVSSGGLGVASQLPISLWLRDAFDAWRVSLDPACLLTDADALTRSSVDGTSVRGLYHRFMDYYGEARADVLTLIPDSVRDVLEIGCARGATARLLQERGCRVVGVELNPEIARVAEQQLDRVIQGDIQQVEPDEEFDLVLALELFEHLTENERFLRRAASWLRPGGQILLSVPNVGHYSIVEDLIAGRWDYLPIGLLCYTHYRFFTRPTLEDWIESCGFTDYEILPQKTPLPERLRALPSSFGADWESLETQGFYVRIRVQGAEYQGCGQA